MKKKILLLFIALLFVTGCFKKERTVEYLLDGYVYAYTKADLKAVKDIFPSFYIEYSKDNLTQENLDKLKKEAEDIVGNDFTITYEVTSKTKLTDEELESLNNKMTKNYNTDMKASECYKLEGSMLIKGSKKEEKSSIISSMGYCKYDGVWYLVRR